MRTLTWARLGLVVAIAMLATWANAQQYLPVPSINFGREDMKVQILGQPIIEVFKPNGPYAEAEKYERYLHGINDPKSDSYVTEREFRLHQEDLRPVDDLVHWIYGLAQVGTNAQTYGQTLTVPEGVDLLVHPGLTRYDGITDIIGTIGGGPPYTPGIFVPGEGWVIPFHDVKPGPREVMVITFDHSNHRKVQVLVFTSGTHRGEGQQFVPYQFLVTEAKDQLGRPFSVYRLTREDLALNYCRGLVSAFTVVQTPNPTSTVFQGQPAHDERIEEDKQSAPQATQPTIRSSVTEEPYQEVKVCLNDSYGHLLQQPLPVTIYSIGLDEGMDKTTLSVQGPTIGRVRRAHVYAVHVQPGFHLEPQEGDSTAEILGENLVTRQAPSYGPVVFVFRQEQQRSSLTRSRMVPTYPKPTTRFVAPSAGPRTIMVHVNPRELGHAHLSIYWISGRRMVGKTALEPGHTTIERQFASHVTAQLPSPFQKRWRLQRRETAAEIQYVAVRRK